MPVRRAARWRRAPTGPCLTVWRHLYCFLGTPLVPPAGAAETLAAVVDAVREGRAGGLLGFDLVGSDGPVAAALNEAAAGGGRALIPYERFERAAAGREAGTGLAVNRKHEREISRMGRRLGEHLGDAVEMRDRSGDDDSVERFLELEASGWKGNGRTALASSPEHRELFREVCRGFSEAGRLQLLSLEASGRPVAMLCSLRAGDTLFLFKTSYDETLARFSPGVQLLTASLQNLEQNDDGLRLMDSCAEPNNAMINRLWGGRVALSSYGLPAPGLRGRTAATAVRTAARLSGRAG